MRDLLVRWSSENQFEHALTAAVWAYTWRRNLHTNGSLVADVVSSGAYQSIGLVSANGHGITPDVAFVRPIYRLAEKTVGEAFGGGKQGVIVADFS